MKELSNCCYEKLVAITSDEGTSFYLCAKCQKPCDPQGLGVGQCYCTTISFCHHHSNPAAVNDFTVTNGDLLREKTIAAGKEDNYEIIETMASEEGAKMNAAEKVEDWEERFDSRWTWASFTWNHDNRTGIDSAKKTRRAIKKFIKDIESRAEAWGKELMYNALYEKMKEINLRAEASARDEGFNKGYAKGLKDEFGWMEMKTGEARTQAITEYIAELKKKVEKYADEISEEISAQEDINLKDCEGFRQGMKYVLRLLNEHTK